MFKKSAMALLALSLVSISYAATTDKPKKVTEAQLNAAGKAAAQAQKKADEAGKNAAKLRKAADDAAAKAPDKPQTRKAQEKAEKAEKAATEAQAAATKARDDLNALQQPAS